MKQYTRRFRGRMASFGVYECHADQHGVGPEQLAQHFTISVSRHGCFAIHRNGRTEIADRTQALAFNVGDVYRTSHPDTCHDDGYYLSFHRDIVLEIARRHDSRVLDRYERPFREIPLRVGPRTTLLGAELADLDSDAMPPRLEQEELALEWLDTLFADNRDRLDPVRETTLPIRSRRDLVNDAKKLIAKDPRRPLALEVVARELEVSPFHLCRTFKSLTGQSLREHIERFRLFLALEAVRDPSRDLSAIAFEHGFSSHSHFTARFRRAFGCTPSRIRRTRS